MKVYERLASAFVAEGVHTIFGMMGDGNMYWMEALDKLGVKMLEVRHEGVGLGMADGWARATHTTGVCTATCGPGVTQLGTALVTASRAASPIVAFVGESPMNDPEYIQRLDQGPFAAACESGFLRVTSPDIVDYTVRKAFYQARVESRPIVFSAPIDVQQKTFDDDEPYKPSSTLATPQATIPDSDRLREAADIVAKSCKPIILVGRGAMWSGAGDAVTKLAKRIGALIVTSLMAKNWLAEDDFHAGISGHFSTRTAMQLFTEADCVIAAGASLNRFTIMGDLLYPNARFVHIDVKPQIMMGGGRGADCYLQADARSGLKALENMLAEHSVQGTGFRTAEVKKQLVNHFADRTEFPIDPGTIDPREVCTVLEEIIPPHVSLTIGTGAASGFSTVLFNKPRPYVMSGKFYGCIGQCLPAAMGAIAAIGNKPMMLVDGDASTIMHLSDFDTAVRYNLPLLIVVGLNDEALGSEYHKLNAHHMKAELSAIQTPDLGAVAKAFGGRGALARNIEDMRKAAAEWVGKPGPMIIDARISRSVQTIRNRRILYGQDE